jgi:transcriptional regulator with XRE-family HTH domain
MGGRKWPKSRHGEADIKVLFGRRVRQHRKLAGLSQEDFAHTVDLDRSYFGSVERGERNISLENIAVIAAGLGVPPAELLRFDSSLTSRRRTPRMARQVDVLS